MTKLKAPIHAQAASGKMDEETIVVTRRGKTYRKRYVVRTMRSHRELAMTPNKS